MAKNNSSRVIRKPSLNIKSNIIKQLKKFKKALKISPLFYTVFLSSIIIIIGLIFPIVNLYKDTNSVLFTRGNAFETYIEAQSQLKDKNIQLYSDRLEKSFTDEQLTKIIDKVTTYSIFINNKALKKNEDTFYSNSKITLVTFYEKYSRDAKDLVPEELLKKHSKILIKDIDKVIKIYTNKAKYKITEQFFEDGRKVFIQFDGVDTGEIITLDMESNFAKALGLEVNSIEIFHNKT